MKIKDRRTMEPRTNQELNKLKKEKKKKSKNDTVKYKTPYKERGLKKVLKLLN